MYVITTAPDPIVTLAEARLQLRVFPFGSPPTHPDDPRIQRLIDASTEYIDGPNGVLNRALLTQSWAYIENAFPAGNAGIELQVWPINSIDGITYTDAEGNAATMDPTTYVLDDSTVMPTTAWPTTTANTPVTVAFTAGMTADPATLPAMIKEAILLRVEAHYDLDPSNQQTLLDRSADMLENLKAGGGGVG
jgi:uncharacterized phiE125 gp8 family phage protein